MIRLTEVFVISEAIQIGKLSSLSTQSKVDAKWPDALAYFDPMLTGAGENFSDWEAKEEDGNLFVASLKSGDALKWNVEENSWEEMESV